MAKRTDAQPTLPMQDLWDRFLGRSADSRDLPGFLKMGKGRWALGTIPDVLSRSLAEEEIIQRKRPERRLSFPIEEMTRLKMTRRIDGILPMPIPVPEDMRQLGKELIRECLRLGMNEPGSQDAALIRDEISVCYLAFLHRRKILLNYQLEMELVATCPGTTGVSAASGPASASQTGDQLTLMGILPLGGRTVVFYSSLDVSDWTDLPAGALEHHNSLRAVRRRDGKLRLTGDEDGGSA